MAQLPSFALADGIVYGPIRSRRLGLSLGLNLLPFGVKVCGFNCSYCQCGWTYATVDRRTLSTYSWPTPEAVAHELERALAAGPAPDSITFSGNGEPTLNPWFRECVRAARFVRDQRAPRARLTILSHGLFLDDAAVVEGLNELDERMIKIDAGNEAMFLDMNTPTVPVSLEEVVAGIARLRDVTVQTMFTRGRLDNTTIAEVDSYIALLRRLRPRPQAVHLYSIARAPADPRLHPVERETLHAIAQRVRHETGLSAEVF